MLVHLVNLGGCSLGSRDIMAVSRAWAHSFAGLRRLHSLSSVSVSRTWTQPAFEPVVHQNRTYARHTRFVAHAAALEESAELPKKRGERLSRAERYTLVENFIRKHKDDHEGKWPSLTTILKETGGSRVIVKDIVDELTTNWKSSISTAPSSFQQDLNLLADSGATPEVREEQVKLALNSEQGDISAAGVELKASSDTLENNGELQLGSDEFHTDSGKANSSLGEIANDTSTWRRLQNFGNPRQDSQNDSKRGPLRQSPDHVGRSPPVTFDSYDTDLDEEEDSDLVADDYEEASDVEQEVATGSGSTNGKFSGSSTVSVLESHGLFIRFLPLSATEVDLRAAFEDCGEIVRAQAMQPKGSGLRFTYGFVDFSTPEALAKALRKEKVFIKGSTVITEPCSGPRRYDSRPTSVRNPIAEPSKRIFSSSRPVNGIRSTLPNRPRQMDGPVSNDRSVRPTSSKGSHFVAVEGLPYPMPISAIEKMLSAHGEIARSELAREEGATYSAQVEFKTDEARESALAAGRVYLGGRWCRITTGEPIVTTVVRLSNVGFEASENFILQRCGKFGRVEDIVQRKEGVIDVYYHPSERKNMRKILDRLSEVTADFKRWHATLAPKCSLQEIRNSVEIQDWVEAQKDRLLDNLTAAMKSMSIDLEDLRDLVEAERSDLSSSGVARNSERTTSKWTRP